MARAHNVNSCIIDSGAERKRNVTTCANSFTQTQSAGSRVGRSRADSTFSPLFDRQLAGGTSFNAAPQLGGTEKFGRLSCSPFEVMPLRAVV